MASRSDFESYVMGCVRKYEEKNPDKIIHARKMVEIPKSECNYCMGNEKIMDIPFGTRIYLKGKNLMIDTCDELIGAEIKHCPMCGREL